MHAAQPLIDGQLARHPQAARQAGVQLQCRLVQTPLPPAGAELQLQAVQALAVLLQIECSQTANQGFGIGGTGTERIRRNQCLKRADADQPGLDNVPLGIGQQISIELRQ
ncbi:hypothetical protein D3C79_990710 [compost metagenome]